MLASSQHTIPEHHTSPSVEQVDFQEELGETRHSEMAAGEVEEPVDLRSEEAVEDSSRGSHRWEHQCLVEAADHQVPRQEEAEVAVVAAEEASPPELHKALQQTTTPWTWSSPA